MSISIQADGDDFVVTLVRRGPKAKMERVLDSAARLRFSRNEGDHGTEKEPRTFDDQSTQERLNLIGNYLPTIVVGDAETWDNMEAQRVINEAKVPQEF